MTEESADDPYLIDDYNKNRPFSANLQFPKGENIDFTTQKAYERIKTAGSHKQSLIQFILDNETKLRLIFSIKDPGSRGLLSIPDFTSCLQMLENPEITEASILHLIALTGCKSSTKIYYNTFLKSLSKSLNEPHKPQSSHCSDSTSHYSKASIIPLAKQIWEKRVEFTKNSQENGMRPRVLCTISELLTILRRSNVSLNIHQLKAVLKECNFIQASPLDLLRGVRDLLAPVSSNLSVFSEIASHASSWAPMRSENIETVKKYLNDYNLQEFFKKASRKVGELELDDFVRYITHQSKGEIKGFEAETAFRKASKGKLSVSEAEFIAAFETSSNAKVELSSMEKVKKWLKTNRLSTLQGFKKLIEYGGGGGESLSKERFVKAVARIDIAGKEAELLFRLLDSQNDAKLDLAEWKKKVYEEDSEYELKVIAMAHGLDPNEILMKMDLKGQSKLTADDLAQSLKRVDQSLTAKKALEIARSFTGQQAEISVNELIEGLSSYQESGWMSSILERIKDSGRFEAIKSAFEEADKRCIGKIEVTVFAEFLEKVRLGLKVSEIDKLAKALAKGLRHIDYIQFLDKINPKVTVKDPLKDIVARINIYLLQNRMTPEEFIRKSGGKIALGKFSEFLSEKIKKHLSIFESTAIAKSFDLNKDEFIDITDLLTSMEKHKDLEDHSSLAKERIEEILADFRKVLKNRHWSFQDAFMFFDSKKNGLISYNDFADAIESLIDIASNAKRPLFNYFDKHEAGLIDFDTFAEALKVPDPKTEGLKVSDPKADRLKVLNPKGEGLKAQDIKSEVTTDSWDWENSALERLRQWISTESVSVEEAFRAFDKDFDGILAREDLRKALGSVLKYSEKEITDIRLERFYKLLDVYKRDSIQLSDFKCIFEEKHLAEWKDSAKQTLGLYISKNYKNPSEIYEELAGKSNKLTLQIFSNWISSTQILSEYRLTPQLISQLFAYLCSRKKGYMSLEDWELCLGMYNYKASCFQEVKDAIRSNFTDVKLAFDYFLSFHRGTPPEKISIKDFEKALEAIIPKRFQKKDISILWKQAFKELPFVGFKEFKEIFDNQRFLSSFAPMRPRSASASTFRPSRNPPKRTEDPLTRLQALIRASPYSIEDIFRSIDTDKSGSLSISEFKAALHKFNIGLSAIEFESLLSRIDSNHDGKIDWQEFQKHFKSSDTESQIKSSCQQRLNSLRLNINNFLLSARDAFHQFDPERTGKLTFNAFTLLIQKVSELSRQPVPSFIVIKDLFDIIDIKKDGYLDMREWLNSFKEVEKNVWEESQQFEEICKNIIRNRKMLLEGFEQVSRGGKVTYEYAKEVLATAMKELRVSEGQWRKIVGRACDGNFVDYKALLEQYKQKASVFKKYP